MNDRFSPKARAMWRAISPETREKIPNNVWCIQCRKGTTMTDFSGRVKKGDLVLTGRCATCGGEVARLIEGA